jgi:ABC-2 type transport system ATP-binding protein
MEPVVEAYGISKSFGATKAIDNVTFSVDRSEIFGLIGPDGAGKTTLFRVITTLMLPDSGSIRVLGMDGVDDYRELRKHIGYMPGRFSLYHDLSVEENLNFYATVFGTTVKENYELIADIYSHIEPFRKRLAGKLSGGMKQKLALSCALIHKPYLLVLDEPTTGVDAVSRVEFWEMLRKLKAHNITILVSTPYMDEAMRCDRVALLQQGKILIIDKPDGIRKGFSRKLFMFRAPEKHKLLTTIKKFPGTYSAYPFGDSIHVTFRGDAFDEGLNPFLIANGISNATYEEARAGIEDRFLELMENGTAAQRHNGITEE